jgi:uncharacterized protein YihD (DUF1040 family)
MRDPERIPLILDKIHQVWSRDPDLRLGQFLCNFLGRTSWDGAFYLEDDKIEVLLDKALE